MSRKEDTIGKIVKEAKALINKDGFTNLSMRKLAKKINYSPTTIYLYFKNKDDLAFYFIEDMFRIIEERISALIYSMKGTALDLLKQGLKTYINTALEHPEQYSMAFQMQLKDKEKYLFKENSHHFKAFSLLIWGVKTCIDTGLIKKQDAEKTAFFLWSSIHGFVSLQISIPDYSQKYGSDMDIDLFINNLIGGLL
jgi:AcrR family transcriptional regulator